MSNKNIYVYPRIFSLREKKNTRSVYAPLWRGWWVCCCGFSAATFLAYNECQIDKLMGIYFESHFGQSNKTFNSIRHIRCTISKAISSFLQNSYFPKTECGSKRPLILVILTRENGRQQCNAYIGFNRIDYPIEMHLHRRNPCSNHCRRFWFIYIDIYYFSLCVSTRWDLFSSIFGRTTLPIIFYPVRLMLCIVVMLNTW